MRRRLPGLCWAVRQRFAAVFRLSKKYLSTKHDRIHIAARSTAISTPLLNPVNPQAPEQDLSVGIPEIDDEHRRFFIDIYALEKALRGSRQVIEVHDLMAELVENALDHFAHEEQLFKKFGFPGLSAHAGTHDQIATRLLDLKQDFEATHFSRKWLEVGAMLETILLNHILQDDMKYRDFLHQYRIQPTA